MKNNTYLLLLCIICFGLFLRTYKLTSVPSGFFCDEASIGYNAYKILTTGKDEYGTFLPVFFRSFDDYKGGVAIYATVPFIALFGLNELATRLPSALFGVATIIFLFFIGKEIKNKNLGLICAFIASITPWLIHYDRVAFLMNVYATFFTAAVFSFIKARTDKRYLLLAFIISGLTLYTYQPPKLMIPLLIFGCSLIFFHEYKKYLRYYASGLFVFGILCIPLIESIITGEAFSRFNMVSVFSAHKTSLEILSLLFSHYFFQLSPLYLFTQGEPTFITRHFTNGLTPLLLVTAPFLILGLLITFLHRKEKINQLLLFLFIIYPIGGVLVLDPPFSSRSIIGAPLFSIIISLGIYQFMLWIKDVKKVVRDLLYTVISLGLFLNILSFFTFYFYTYPSFSSDFWGWQYGAKNIVGSFVQNENNYDELIMEPAFNAPDIFFKFYAPNDCIKCKVGYLQNAYTSEKKQLFAVSPEYLAVKKVINFKTKQTIFYPNGTVAFLIGEVVQ